MARHWSTVLAALLTMVLLVPCLATARNQDPAPASVGSAAPDEEGFVPVSTDDLSGVDGKKLTIAAYAIILGLFVAYSAFLFLRQRAVHRALMELKKHLGS